MSFFPLLLCFLTAIYTSVVFRNRFSSVHDRFLSYQITAIHHTCSMFTLKLSLSRKDDSLHLFAVLARFWIFVMFDKSFRISLDFIKEKVRQETQTFDDGQHEYEGVVVREDEELQYDKSTGIASCATILRQMVPMNRQAPPVLWTKYNDDDLWPEDQRIQEDVILECDNNWIREIVSLRSLFKNCRFTWIGRRKNHVDDALLRNKSISSDLTMEFRSWIARFDEVQFKWTPHHCNVVADSLSTMALPSNLNLINYTFVSYVIHEQILSESTI